MQAGQQRDQVIEQSAVKTESTSIDRSTSRPVILPLGISRPSYRAVVWQRLQTGLGLDSGQT